MATKTFSGQLDQAIEGAASGNKLLFVPQENLGEVLMGAASEMTVGADGTYSITLAYNTYSVYHYSDVTKNKILIADGVEVSASTSVSTIPDLIGVSVPVTDTDVLTNQGYLQEGQDYAASAKTSAENSDELFNSFGLRVGQAIEPIETGVPILDIPFNDSGILKKGIGTEYVSGLPVYGVDFTRSTTSTVINKSGVLEPLSADVIGIGDNGAWLHDDYTVKPSYTNDFTQGVWGKVSTTISDSGETWSGLTVYSVTDGSGSGFRSLRTLQNITTGDGVGVTVIASAGTGSQFKVIIGGVTEVLFDLDSGTYSSINAGNYASMEALSDGFYRCFVSSTSTSTNSAYVIKVLEYQGTTSTSGDYVNLAYAGVSNLLSPVPVVINTGSESSITSTLCDVDVIGNIPTGSITIACDVSFISASETAFWLGISGSTSFYLESNLSTIPRVVSSFSSTITKDDYTTGERIRCVTVVDTENDNTAFYVDGDLVGSTTMSGWFDDFEGVLLQIGSRNYSSKLNNQIKNFKILPYAASADEVKSWGAPK